MARVLSLSCVINSAWDASSHGCGYISRLHKQQFPPVVIFPACMGRQTIILMQYIGFVTSFIMEIMSRRQAEWHQTVCAPFQAFPVAPGDGVITGKAFPTSYYLVHYGCLSTRCHAAWRRPRRRLRAGTGESKGEGGNHEIIEMYTSRWQREHPPRARYREPVPSLTGSFAGPRRVARRRRRWERVELFVCLGHFDSARYLRVLLLD